MSHLMISLGGVPETVTEWVGKQIETRARAWSSYFPGQWIVCTAYPFDSWIKDLGERVQNHRGYLLVIDLGNHPPRTSGVLPQEAWKWMRDHHFRVG